MADSCLFCRIVNLEIPAKIIAESAYCVAFRDINAQAPSHALVIPKRHVESLNQLDDMTVIGEMVRLAKQVARDESIEASGYRLVINTNAQAGQTVFHLHLHVLGGRQMAWPPG